MVKGYIPYKPVAVSEQTTASPVSAHEVSRLHTTVVVDIHLAIATALVLAPAPAPRKAAQLARRHHTRIDQWQAYCYYKEVLVSRTC